MKEQPNSNHVTDRRGASAKRSSDIAPAQWPVITRAAYDAMQRANPVDVNLKMKRLSMGKIRLGQAMLAIDGALQDHNPQVKGKENTAIYNKLRGARKKIADAFAAYPLEVR